MLNHEELIEMWKKDCVINPLRLSEELYKQPLLHSKYLEMLQAMKIKIRSLHRSFDKMREVKIRYYSGHLTKEELDHYKWDQYQYTVPTKTKMESLLDADTDLQTIREKIEYIKIMAETCESIMREISARGFNLKSVIEWEKFQGGG
ncbi:hypothetical protein [Synechococcus phage BUCT-ZZ01]|nr:hypothetical protein [Synechococcus phage BUCT-ZZ01]